MRFPPYGADAQHLVAASADPVRYGLVALAVESVLREGIEGDLAEVGVHRGELSRLIHLMAPARTLFLFDTFEGFPDADLEHSGDTRFRDTSMDMVRRRVGDLTTVEFRAGYFPDTAAGLEGRTFALVVLDLDLYKPTVAGLDFFYSRIAPGGYLIIDDYNNSESGWAVSRAVKEFMADKPEHAIQIPDAWGTLVLRKV
jgi:O-methyltransferase